MDRALPRLTRPAPDPKRIAANSAVICLHALVLMVLMLPTATAPPVGLEEKSMIVLPEFKPLPRPVPPPKPVEVKLLQTTSPPQPIPPAQDSAPIFDTPGPVDLPAETVPDVEPLQDVVSGPVFAQISADVAPAPPYPARALKLRQTGVVMLRVLVGSNGRPLEVTVDQSSGHRLLDEAARKFVQARWHFVPAMQGGAAVQAYARVPISFELDD